MNIEFFIGHSGGSFLVLLSIYIYTKIQGNRERKELSKAIESERNFLPLFESKTSYCWLCKSTGEEEGIAIWDCDYSYKLYSKLFVMVLFIQQIEIFGFRLW